MSSTQSSTTESSDFYVECYWERNPTGEIVLDCNLRPVNGNKTVEVSQNEYDRVQEVIKSRVPYMEYQTDDVARIRVFSDSDTPPAVLLLADTVDETEASDIEVALLKT